MAAPNNGGFGINLDEVIHPRGNNGAGAAAIGMAGLERVPIFVLANPMTGPEMRLLNLAWAVVLEDPNPPAVIVQLLVELTCSAYYNNPNDLVDHILPMVGPGGYALRVSFNGLGRFTIPGRPELERLVSDYIRPRIQRVMNDRAWTARLAPGTGLVLWQVMLIQLCLASGHLFTGNTALQTWFTRRVIALQLNTRIDINLTGAIFAVLVTPGGSLTVVRCMIVQVMMATLASQPLGVPLVEGIRAATNFSEWAGMAWAFLSLTLVMRSAHPILLVPSVRREALAFVTAIQGLGANRLRLPFERILGASLSNGLNAGNFPTLSSAAYGVASATFCNFAQFNGTIYSMVVYRAAQILTRVVTAVDTGVVDPLTGLQGQPMTDATRMVTEAMSEASQAQQGGNVPTI
ncbi:nucleoprotein [Wenling thamnaconus septentrionalis filovirus]|uniref:Nucleoprotein n=1 Tax=Wenling thamnaconus septentrionalis filovirus TaxID=2116488 RepID=A0A2P1GMM5_9MONO|nr:nucleoprotein [Wenling thamnaconus septentrionalis filovirus]AVM87243.1 nucleoprotein [Wenling thamnaconus septentrionalis filovirus]